MPQKSHQHKDKQVKIDEERLARASGCAQGNQKTANNTFLCGSSKKGTNNSLDAKEVMNQMAQMMSNWNANGLKNNLEELKDCIIDYNPDVIGIQETHLRPADRVSIPNYTCHRSDRTTHRGGGTALFVKNSIRHHAILNVSNTFENSSVILQLGNNSKITVACIYRPPHGSINSTELDAILIHSNKAFLFGDFNARHPSWNPGRANSNGNILCNWAVGSALDILAPDTPTHFNSRHSNAILDIGFAVNLSHTEVFTINTLSSDHNPVIFDFVTNNALPPILRTLKTTNWIKFQEIISHTIPGNPRIDDLDLAVQNFTSNISNAISASTSTRLITTPHLRLPENIRELIRAKNRFRKLWNETRYPPYKREVNALIRQIRKEIQEHKNRTWKDFLLTLNPEDNSLYNLHRKFSKRHIPLPPLHGPGGMAYSDFEKAEVFKDTLEVTFQENEEPYCDDKIEEVESLVDDYFDNFATCTPLSLPLRGNGGYRPAFPTYTFDDYIQWVPVVKYLGLHIDSRLTFKKHIDYLSEKFWGRISLAISLVGRRSPLSLENKVILYKQILRPVITYGSPVWGAAAATHMKKYK
ncbi:probable RNA-directed DNA polymerase from transposon X-element [Trichonephila clavipes]|nr:probable RNA-directed DNA polymerase from transposon X-element [Trichonephila clavipes]